MTPEEFLIILRHPTYGLPATEAVTWGTHRRLPLHMTPSEKRSFRLARLIPESVNRRRFAIACVQHVLNTPSVSDYLESVCTRSIGVRAQTIRELVQANITAARQRFGQPPAAPKEKKHRAAVGREAMRELRSELVVRRSYRPRINDNDLVQVLLSATRDACDMVFIADAVDNMARAVYYANRVLMIDKRPHTNIRATEEFMPVLVDLWAAFAGAGWEPRDEYRTTDVLALAQGILADDDPSRLPILADALQEAGCPDTQLELLRQPQPVARGLKILEDLARKA